MVHRVIAPVLQEGGVAMAHQAPIGFGTAQAGTCPSRARPRAAAARIRDFAGEGSQVAAARAFVVQVAHGHPRRDDAELVVSELAANAVVHCGGAAFRVVVQHLSGRRLRITVISGPAVACPVLRPAGCGPESGRGLAIVAALAGWWDVEHADGGHRVTALLDRVAPEVPEPADPLAAFADLDGLS